MSDRKRKWSASGSESEPKQVSGLKSRYSKHARDIARYALLVQGTGRPIKKKEIYEALGLTSKDVALYIKEADDFLREQFCMQLYPLKNAVPANGKHSAAWDEYVVVSKMAKNRTLLAKIYPEYQRKDYGVMLFVIMLIVLKDDLVSFDEIYAAYRKSHLHLSEAESSRDATTGDANARDATGQDEAAQDEAAQDETAPDETARDDAQVKEDLLKSLGRLESMRAFKLEVVEVPGSREQVKKYRVGPYALAIVDARTLSMMILRLHFPEDKSILNTPEGHEKYKSARELIKKRLAACQFKEKLS